MLSRNELAAWLRLSATHGLSRAAARRLLAAFGSPEAILAGGMEALREFVAPAVATALLRPDDRLETLLDTTRHWLESAPQAAPRELIVLGDERYPPLLLHTADPPLLLYASGRVDLLRAPSLAIVGSRHATPQGMDNARSFAHFLSGQALTIVSGLALGVDGAAHEGGLAGPGRTVAFVATGLDQVYPKRHAALCRRIEENGLVASEYPLGTPPLEINFPRRNRLIAGVAQGTLVVEAALQSGSLITARMALEAGREVFAIPGSIHSPQSRGCHQLIQQGAKLVETAADILDELRPPAPQVSMARAPRPLPAAPKHEPAWHDSSAHPDAALLQALGHDPVSFDALAARTGLPSDRLSARLLELELEGALQRLPGGLMQRRASA